jgi:hypothetical protein
MMREEEIQNLQMNGMSVKGCMVGMGTRCFGFPRWLGLWNEGVNEVVVWDLGKDFQAMVCVDCRG